MAKASTQTDDEFFRAVYVGDSGTGKTGSLLSLIEAGYQVKVLDMDNGIEPPKQLIKHHCPERLDQLDYITLRDKFKADPVYGIKVDGQAKAYKNAIKYLNKWDDDSIPSEWGKDTVFVLDTLGSFGRAAFLWAQSMSPNVKDGRQWYGTSQESIRTVLDLLTSSDFKCHVLVSSHIQLIELSEGVYKGQVSAIGKALGGDIPKVFNTMIQAESIGTGENVKRSILTKSTGIMDLKTTIPWELQKKLPLESGLATIFEKVTGRKPA
ncbi:MAG: hypothetical protein CL484_03195 [Acidobacteria bacterium]|nr:hypothetical protein [Acidobacteriota bacterium]